MSKKVSNYLNKHGGLMLVKGEQIVIVRCADEYDEVGIWGGYILDDYASPEDDDPTSWQAPEIESLVYLMRMYENDLRKWGGLQC